MGTVSRISTVKTSFGKKDAMLVFNVASVKFIKALLPPVNESVPITRKLLMSVFDVDASGSSAL